MICDKKVVYTTRSIAGIKTILFDNIYKLGNYRTVFLFD